MDYKVTFMGVYVESDSESEAEQLACRIMAEDPSFYLIGAETREEDGNHESR